MSLKLKPYPEYKDPSVTWLGPVPVHWEVLPNRVLFTEVNDRNHPNEQMLSVTIAAGVIRQVDLLTDTSKKDSSNEDKSNYKLVEPRDIAYNKMRAWQGAVGVSQYRGIVSPAYVVVRPRVETNSKYFHYLLRTPAFAKEAESWSYGISSDQWSLRPEDFKRIYCALPPNAEQDRIVQFLTAHDQLIDRLVLTETRCKVSVTDLLWSKAHQFIPRKRSYQERHLCNAVRYLPQRDLPRECWPQ